MVVMYRVILLLSVPALSVPASSFAQHVRHRKLVARVDSIALETLRSGTPGMSIAVARGKDILVSKGYGYARLMDSTPAGSETVYPIASITKQFTAAAVLQLAEENRIKLKDEFSRHLPEYATRQRFTIQQLLNHTSGIPDEAAAPDFAGRQRSTLDMTPQQFLVAFANRSYDFPPGEKFAYSNAGYYLLGLLIEKISGQKYSDYILEHLFDPAIMTESAYCGPDRPNRARGYDQVDTLIVPATPIGDDELYAAAGLCSSVRDLIKWQRALFNGKLINNFSWKQMVEPAELKDGSHVSYGYGMTLGRLGKHPWVGHGGSVRGFSSQISFYPGADVTVVVLANSERALTRRVADRIAGIVLGVPEPRVKDVPIPAEDLDRYAGVYDLAGDRLEVFQSSGRLMMRIGTGDGIALLFQGSREFVTEPDPATKLLFRFSRGRSKSLVFSAGALTLNASLITDASTHSQ